LESCLQKPETEGRKVSEKREREKERKENSLQPRLVSPLFTLRRRLTPILTLDPKINPMFRLTPRNVSRRFLEVTLGDEMVDERFVADG